MSDDIDMANDVAEHFRELALARRHRRVEIGIELFQTRLLGVLGFELSLQPSDRLLHWDRAIRVELLQPRQEELGDVEVPRVDLLLEHVCDRVGQ